MAAYALLTNAIAANNPPAVATDGVELRSGYSEPVGGHVLVLKSTAGSGTMTVTIKLWGYYSASGAWHPLGTHATAATKGIINGGNAIGETGADTIRHVEALPESSWPINAADRIYAEVTTIGGAASTAISAWLIPVAK